MILCDREILEAMQDGRVVIDPRPDPAHMSSTSIDLTLGNTLDYWEIPPNPEAMGIKFRPGLPGWHLDEISKQYLRMIELSEAGYDLLRGGFVLGWTAEKIYLPHTSRLCARVEGKSSLARLGLGVHVTAPTIHAGFGYNKNDPGASGAPLRLEIWNVGPLPIELRRGMRICQMIVEEVRERPSTGYEGQFNLQGPPRL